MRPEALDQRLLPDGRELTLYLLVCGRSRILVGEPEPSQIVFDSW